VSVDCAYVGDGDDARAWGPPWVGNESSYFLSINRNKKAIEALCKYDKRCLLGKITEHHVNKMIFYIEFEIFVNFPSITVLNKSSHHHLQLLVYCRSITLA